MTINKPFLEGKELFEKGEYDDAKRRLRMAIGVADCNPLAYLYLGKLSIYDKDYVSAINYLQRYLEEKDDNQATLLIADCYLKIGDKETAYYYYDELTNTTEDYWEPYFEMSKILTDKKEYDTAFEYILKAKEISKNEDMDLHINLLEKKIKYEMHEQQKKNNPKKSIYLFSLLKNKTLEDKEFIANCHASLGDFEKAKEILKEIVEEGDGNQNSCYHHLFELYSDEGNEEAKKELIKKILDKNPKNAWANFNKMILKIEIDEDEIKQEKPQIQSKPKEKEIKTDDSFLSEEEYLSTEKEEQIFNNEFESEDIDKQENEFQSNEKDDNFKTETDYEFQSNEKDDNFKTEKNDEEKEDDFKTEKDDDFKTEKNDEFIEQDYLDEFQKESFDFSLTEKKQQEEQEESFIEENTSEKSDLEVLVSSEEKNFDLSKEFDEKKLYEISTKFIDNRHYKKAIDNLKRIIELDQNNFLAYVKLGWCMQLKRKIVMAEYYYKKALTLEPKNHLIYDSLGLLYIQKKNYLTAEVNFKKSIRLNPTSFALKELGKIYELQKKYEEARELYMKAFKLDDNEEAYEHLEKLEN